ncbi:MAG: hypothetical protein EAZ55_00240 [Cytophagales bacterium]|nr:MAG: hypothetical protein EAZ55_00240 [Cytophagales bacterium]
MTTIILGVVFMGVFALLMSVGLLVRGKELKGTCASQNPELAKLGIECTVCGKVVGSCENEEANLKKISA